MFHRIEHILFPIAIIFSVVIGVLLYRNDFSLPSTSVFSTLIPQSVGDKAAPIPVLDVQNIELTEIRNLTSAQVRQSISSSIGSRTATPKYALREYFLRWNVSVENGVLAPVTAQVFVPMERGTTRFSGIVYGPGSTGLSDRCAPSKEDLRRGNMGDYRNYMIAQASQGYIVVMPNYEGFDNPDRNQHYFNKDNEARTLLSAVKALVTTAEKNSLPLNASAVFLGGYSQGGHAAFSAADYAETYLPELKLAGVYGHGPTTNVVDLLHSNPNLAAYFFASYSEYYPAIKPEEILTPTWVKLLERARVLCVNEGFSAGSTSLDAVFLEPFKQALIRRSLDTDFPSLAAIFAENNAGTSYTNISTMIVQGTADPIVTLREQDEFVRGLCRRDVSVNYKRYPGTHHFQTRSISFADTNAWINAVASGIPVQNNCYEFLTE